MSCQPPAAGELMPSNSCCRRGRGGGGPARQPQRVADQPALGRQPAQRQRRRPRRAACQPPELRVWQPPLVRFYRHLSSYERDPPAGQQRLLCGRAAPFQRVSTLSHVHLPEVEAVALPVHLRAAQVLGSAAGGTTPTTTPSCGCPTATTRLSAPPSGNPTWTGAWAPGRRRSLRHRASRGCGYRKKRRRRRCPLICAALKVLPTPSAVRPGGRGSLQCHRHSAAVRKPAADAAARARRVRPRQQS